VAIVGYVVFRQFSEEVIAATTAVAAGAILVMLAESFLKPLKVLIILQDSLLYVIFWHLLF
jgi:zinc transporter ZupT